MKYCNIVFEKELVNHKHSEFVNYFNYSIDYKDIKNNLPTLYVGWLFLKKCGLLNVDILKSSIIENKLFWTPSFEENKASHVNGVASFISLAPTLHYTINYNYIDIDPVMCKLYSNDDILACIGNNFDKLYQYKTDIIYLLRDNKIFGLNLKMFEFFNFDTAQLLSSIYSKTSSKTLDNSGDIYVEHFKKLPYFKYLKRFIVCMLEN